MNLAPEIMKKVLEIVEGPYTLRNETKLKSRKIHYMLNMALSQHLLLVLACGTVYPVTLKSVNSLSFSNQKSKIGFLKTALANFVKLTCNESAKCKFPIKRCIFMTFRFRGGSLSPESPGKGIFVTRVNN